VLLWARRENTVGDAAEDKLTISLAAVPEGIHAEA
jgi:hypothetical protein